MGRLQGLSLGLHCTREGTGVGLRRASGMIVQYPAEPYGIGMVRYGMEKKSRVEYNIEQYSMVW